MKRLLKGITISVLAVAVLAVLSVGVILHSNQITAIKNGYYLLGWETAIELQAGPAGVEGLYSHLMAQPLRGREGEGYTAPIIEVYDYFTPEWAERLAYVPIYKIWEVSTAMCYNARYVEKEDAFVCVSVYWDDPAAFSERFKRHLLVHEYLHIIEAEIPVDLVAFYNDVQKWYQDTGWGEATPGDNYTKYYLSHWLYASESDYYHDALPGVEEFAMIGTLLVRGHASEVPGHILDYYAGVLNADIFSGYLLMDGAGNLVKLEN